MFVQSVAMGRRPSWADEDVMDRRRRHGSTKTSWLVSQRRASEGSMDYKWID